MRQLLKLSSKCEDHIFICFNKVQHFTPSGYGRHELFIFSYSFLFAKGKSYGQRQPPLTHILRSILERYPDGGQILKVQRKRCGILYSQQQLSLQGPFQIWIFFQATLQQCKMIDGDKLNSLNFHFPSNIY